ncbi:MAG: carbon monoxide dehydrogenase subunit G [Chloroflexota bacterium]
MKVDGSYTFEAPVARVWEVLLSPDSLASCVPGCDSMTPTGQDQWDVSMKVGVAAIRGSYKGKIRVADKDEPKSFKLIVEGSGGAGFVRGEALIHLVDQGATTQVNVAGEGNVGGTVAGVGQRMLGGVAKMLMGNFFDCLRKQL